MESSPRLPMKGSGSFTSSRSWCIDVVFCCERFGGKEGREVVRFVNVRQKSGVIPRVHDSAA